jgi:hypothetical protein
MEHPLIGKPARIAACAADRVSRTGRRDQGRDVRRLLVNATISP